MLTGLQPSGQFSAVLPSSQIPLYQIGIDSSVVFVIIDIDEQIRITNNMQTKIPDIFFSMIIHLQDFLEEPPYHNGITISISLIVISDSLYLMIPHCKFTPGPFI